MNGKNWTFAKCANIETDPCSCTFTNPDGGDGGVTCEGGAITAIDLNSVNLSGSLSNDLAQLTKLTSLSLYGNQISGSVPASLSQLTALTSLALHDNSLSGSIPKSLAKLTHLSSLALQCNSLSGTVPELPFAQYTDGCGIGGGRRAILCGNTAGEPNTFA